MIDLDFIAACFVGTFFCGFGAGIAWLKIRIIRAKRKEQQFFSHRTATVLRRV